MDSQKNKEQEFSSALISVAYLFTMRFFEDVNNHPDFVKQAATEFTTYLDESKSIISEDEDIDGSSLTVNEFDSENVNNVNLNLQLEIHFHQQTEASIFMESSSSGFNQKYGEILLFCLVALRQMVNANKPDITVPLSNLLQEVGEYIRQFGNHTPEDGTKLIQYTGSPGRKRFIGALEFKAVEGIYKFNWKLKGFGIFSGGLGYYAPVSVTLLLQHLVRKNEYDEQFLAVLAKAARLCGELYNSGVINIRNQSKYALEITNQTIIYLR
jgi:hypothetical protein